MTLGELSYLSTRLKRSNATQKLFYFGFWECQTCIYFWEISKLLWIELWLACRGLSTASEIFRIYIHTINSANNARHNWKHSFNQFELSGEWCSPRVPLGETTGLKAFKSAWWPDPQTKTETPIIFLPPLPTSPASTTTITHHCQLGFLSISLWQGSLEIKGQPEP